MKVIIQFIFLFSIVSNCGSEPPQIATRPETANAEPVEVPSQNGLERAYFASGCFWCVEAVFQSVKGVKKAVSGYSGGHTRNPTYESSNTGRTGHAETVEVVYDPDLIEFRTLVDVYFGSMDPTQVNGQGPDIGSQYRSIIFYQNQKQKELIQQKMNEIAQEYDEKVAVEVLPFQKFWVGEDYHQDYELKHPNDPYIQNVSVPRINAFKKKFPELLKEDAH